MLFDAKIRTQINKINAVNSIAFPRPLLDLGIEKNYSAKLCASTPVPHSNSFTKSIFRQIWGKKMKLSVLPENWQTWYLGRAYSESGVRFSKFRSQNPFLGKFGPKKHPLFILMLDVDKTFRVSLAGGEEGVQKNSLNFSNEGLSWKISTFKVNISK